MEQKSHLPFTRVIGPVILFIIGLVLAACIAPAPASTPADSDTVVVEQPTATPQPEPTDDLVTSVPVAPAPEETSVVPVMVELSDLGLDLPVTQMGWRVVATDSGETTSWNIPEESLGWQMNSAGVGEDGNMIIAGHQALGDALLAPLALDEIVPMQDVLVTDGAGTTFRYQITEVSAPLPINGASDNEVAQAAAYSALDGPARLTLITGWPDFTTTHRIFAVAELVGPVE